MLQRVLEVLDPTLRVGGVALRGRQLIVQRRILLPEVARLALPALIVEIEQAKTSQGDHHGHEDRGVPDEAAGGAAAARGGGGRWGGRGRNPPRGRPPRRPGR